MKRLTRTRKLFAFLRMHRQELFDDELQAELESMYRDTGAGREPVPPAMLAMVALLQGYHGISDAEAVEMSVVDLRWAARARRHRTGVLAGRSLRVQGAAHPSRHGPAAPRAHRETRAQDQGVRLEEAPERPPCRRELDASRGSGACRGHDQFARPCRVANAA